MEYNYFGVLIYIVVSIDKDKNYSTYGRYINL